MTEFVADRSSCEWANPGGWVVLGDFFLPFVGLLARGYAYKEVASRLTISVKTVETHASSVLRKLQLSNRHELTRWAAHRRLI